MTEGHVPPKGQRCATCKYWDDMNGLCIRFPPTPIIQTGSSIVPQPRVSAYPQVCEHEWCGEWKTSKPSWWKG